MRDETITGKWRRLVALAPSMGNLGMRVLVNQLMGVPIDHTVHAHAVKDALGTLKGPMMKIAQMLASIPGAVPEEYVDAFRELQASAPPMSPYFARRRLTAELGADPSDVFAKFDDTPIAAASLGQVHAVTRKDGQEFVCKIQYPDIMATVDQDLSHATQLLNVLQQKGKGIEASTVIEELKERLYEELDYRHEAANIQMFSRIFSQENVGEFNVQVPQVDSDLSTSKLLVMSHLKGQHIRTLHTHSQTWRNTLAQTLFKAWYTPFYHYGVIHGDAHSGNFSVNPSTKTLNIFDFGCVRKFSPEFVSGVIDLYRALQCGSQSACYDAYEKWGFTGLTNEVVQILNRWSAFLYEPLLDDRVRPISDAHSGARARKLAVEVFKELQQHPDVKPPREFVFLDRATVGMGGAFMTLKAEINWHRAFEDLIADVSLNMLTINQRNVCK